ncbi:MAG: methyltransferase [Pelagibacterium sp. SCN 63-23]|nr:MAG: methyltransferase [Pelagibacterium sp. SCN 63-23]
MASFAHVAGNYAEGPPRLVPGLAGLHQMARLLLAEKVPADGRVLVLGAGGGMELANFAAAQPGWRFDGVDPSPEMLEAARMTTLEHAARIDLHQGYVEAAPAGPFDGAACLLTLHFVPREQRVPTLKQMRARMRRGAALVVAHMSFAQDENSRDLWTRRHAAFAASNGIDARSAEAGRQAILERLSILAPEEDEALLREAGFVDVMLFYAAFNFRGWVAYAG